MTEEIRGQLSRISALRLLSRAAVEKYGDTEGARAAGELGASHIVTGNVRFDGNRVRIVVELIDTKTRQTLWYEQYERELSDLFVLQSDIAIRVGRALSIRMSSDEQGRVARRPTQNAEAYQLYLRQEAGFAMSKRNENLAAIELLKQALALDPTFAVAEARLAYRTMFLSFYDSSKYIDEASRLSQHSIELDPTLSQGHFALASAYLVKGFYAQARLSFLRALELDRSDVDSMQNLSILELSAGRFDEALYWARRAFQLSARDSTSYRHVSLPILYLRDDDLTLRWLREAQRRFPSDFWPPMLEATIDVMQNRPSEALARVRRASRDVSSDTLKRALVEFALVANADDALALTGAWSKVAPEAHGQILPETPRLWYAFALGKAGNRAGAAPLLQQAEATAKRSLAAGADSPSVPIELAAAAAINGDAKTALTWLEGAYAAGHRDYGVLGQDPIFKSLPTDAGFRQLLDRMQKDVATKRARALERGLLDLTSLN
jgi:tetratricopeptide (TPR) repeat protein